ncbi:type VI secretion system Vgr family protein [Pseudomonas syringae]|uniref:type VI secretion system Vgr family protein n=1 Tax=Pseudomonas syringae TaxID=317 RepID=UPI0008168492|nr:type VI secretion system Vgr family protein [Pseudomonas syringae]
MPANDSSLCSFTSTALPVASGDPTFVVLDWHGEEGISRPYRFEVRLACEQQVLYECMLGERATLILRDDAQAAESKYHGVVTEVEQLESDETYQYYRVVLEPKMALLRQCHFSDVWLKTSLTALIADIMSNVGLHAKPAQDTVGIDYDYTVAFTQNAAVGEAEFICQFEESSFAFLSRRLEQAGVYYYFEQGKDRELLVLCNDIARQGPSSPIALTYFPMNATTTAVTQAVLRSFKRRVTHPVKRVVLQDFNPNIVTGMVMVQGDSRRGASPDSTYIAYGEHFADVATGDLLAGLRAQALSCRESEFHGRGRATELRVGATMMFSTALFAGADNLTSERVDAVAGLAGTYFIIEVKHRGSQPLPTGDTYQAGNGDSETHFIALPSDVQYRDSCKTAKPYIGAPISAFIDAEDAVLTAESRLAGDVDDLTQAAKTLNTSIPELSIAKAASEKADAELAVASATTKRKRDEATTYELRYEPGVTPQLHASHLAEYKRVAAQAAVAEATLKTAADTAKSVYTKAGDTQTNAQAKETLSSQTMLADWKSANTPYLNSEGCYKVRFPFVRASKSGTLCSAFVRMASMSSGVEHGMNLPLLPGTEVLVSFLGGDPDRPIIIGSVPNAVNKNKVNETNKTQSGLSSPLGHFLAMDDVPTGPLMKMGSPAGQSSLTFGQGEVNGVNLRTADHLQLSSSSLKQQVPDIYSLSIGADEVTGSSATAFYAKSPDDFKGLVDASSPTGIGKRPIPPVATIADEIALTTKWGGTPWTIPTTDWNSSTTASDSNRPDISTRLGKSLSLVDLWSSVGWGIANAVTGFTPFVGASHFGHADTKVSGKAPYLVELNTAATQTSANFGTRKEVLDDFQSAIYYSYSGEKANVNIGKGTYIYDTYRKEDATAIQINTTSHSVDTIISAMDATVVDVTSEFYSVAGIVKASISGNKHKITMTEKGIVIEAIGAPILLNGDVVIGGSLLVKDDLLVEGDAGVKADIVVASLYATNASINVLESLTSTDGKAVLTLDPDALMEKTVDTFNLKYGSPFGLGVLSLDRLLGYGALAMEYSLKTQHGLLQNTTGQLGSTIKMPSVAATNLYKSQSAIKGLSHKVESARKAYAAGKKLFSNTSNPQKKIAVDTIKWMD